MRNTDEADALFQKSATLLDQRKYEEAVQALTAAIALVPDRGVYYYQRYAALRFLNRNEEALSDINSAIRLTPRDPGLYVARAYTYCDTGNHQAALSDLSVATEVAPRNSDVFLDAGRIHSQMARYKEALALFDRAIATLESSTGLVVTRSVVKQKQARILYYRGLAHYRQLRMLRERVQRPAFLEGRRLKKLTRLVETDLSSAIGMELPSHIEQDAMATLDTLRTML